MGRAPGFDVVQVHHERPSPITSGSAEVQVLGGAGLEVVGVRPELLTGVISLRLDILRIRWPYAERACDLLIKSSNDGASDEGQVACAARAKCLVSGRDCDSGRPQTLV